MRLTDSSLNDGQKLLGTQAGGTDDGAVHMTLVEDRVVSETADGSDRFIRDAQASHGLRRQASQSLDELPVEHRLGLVALMMVPRRADE